MVLVNLPVCMQHLLVTQQKLNVYILYVNILILTCMSKVVNVYKLLQIYKYIKNIVVM